VHDPRRGNLRHDPAVRSAKAQLTIRLAIELVALFVDGAAVPATEHGEIRECRGAAVGPVTDVMALAEADAAAREAAAAIAIVKRSS